METFCSAGVDEDRIECNEQNGNRRHFKYETRLSSVISDLTSLTPQPGRLAKPKFCEHRRWRCLNEAVPSRYESLRS